jgi:hypothetical protein
VKMLEMVTHRYDPARGACLNVCALPDLEAGRVLERLRRESRPTLKADYLERRRATEEWLVSAAREVLGRAFGAPPVYFFLGDFSYLVDASRPASLVIPLSSLPMDAMTFTLGDSMSVAAERGRRVYTLGEMVGLFADGEALAGFGFCDRGGIQKRFVEVQVWRGRDWVLAWLPEAQSEVWATFEAATAAPTQEKRDFSLRRPTTLQEQSGSKGVGLLRSK